MLESPSRAPFSLISRVDVRLIASVRIGTDPRSEGFAPSQAVCYDRDLLDGLRGRHRLTRSDEIERCRRAASSAG
jgi:hypothetical protein